MGRLENLKPFEVGNPGGPGRPKGSRSKLQEAVIRALYEDFATHGPAAIEKVRQRKPEVYLTACVSLLPKQAQKVESPFMDISDGELEALEQHLAVVRAKMVQHIEATPNMDGQDVVTEPRAESNVDASTIVVDDAA